MKAVSEINPERVFFYFQTISGIPRGSRNTDKISSYLMRFAAECRLYENLIDESKGVYNEDGSMNLNPNSLTVLKECYVEPGLQGARAYDSFQFVRNGFFCVDARDSRPEALVFNRIVSLKSSFRLPAAKADGRS